MPATQGHTGRFEGYDEQAETFFSIKWIHHYANLEDLALSDQEAREIRAETLQRIESLAALAALHERDRKQFKLLFFQAVEETAALGRLLEWSEVEKLKVNPKQIVIDL
jgi:hypothetical protein